MEIPLDRWRFPLEGGHVLRSSAWAQRAEYIHNVPAERKCHSFRNLNAQNDRYNKNIQEWSTNLENHEHQL